MLIRFCPYCYDNNLYRFPVAIKVPNTFDVPEITLFLDEIKSMIEVGTYHEHIVNLQGVAYELDEHNQSLKKVSICQIIGNKSYFN